MSSLSEEFKVPLLPGTSNVSATPEAKVDCKIEAKIPEENKPDIPYVEPDWSGLPPAGYSLEMVKSGKIVQTVPLTGKAVFVIGRLPHCDIPMEHPSLSRYHALLQYRSQDAPEKPCGFYLYDLDSAHGSYHNKNRCFPKTYYRLRVGHAMKFAGSTRLLILQGPPDDVEEESALSVTELQEKTRQKVLEKAKVEALMKIEKEKAAEEKEKEEELRGVSWGMTEDAEEEPDLENNPFAQPDGDNESLYLDDPKKTLRGWFEREGFELEYKCEEKGYATFLCKVELPISSADGGPVVAEVTAKGKKKEAVAQCALEACRILDRQGLLRQTNHESRAKKQLKKWEEEDFYASDEDDYLDRTGSIEKKRQERMRMAGKGEKQEVETFDSLQKKLKIVTEEIADTEEILAKARAAKSNVAEDDLEAFMANLKDVDKDTIIKHKRKLTELRRDADRLTKLVAIAKPTFLPALKTEAEKAMATKPGIMIGKQKGGLTSRRTLNVTKEVTSTTLRAEVTCETKMEKPSTTNERSDVIKDILEPTVDKQVHKTVKSTPGSLELGAQKCIAVGEPVATELVGQQSLVSKTGTKNRTRKRRLPHNEIAASDDSEAVSGSYDSSDPKYAVWMPPEGQSGDGRTGLNDKLGY